MRSLIRSMQRLEPALAWVQSLLLLFIRLNVAKAFFASGLTKLRDWDITVAIFTDEYHVPLLSPSVAALLGTTAELALPVLLAFGIAGRFGALGLFVFNIVALIAYPALEEAQLVHHFYWGVMLATVALFGSGKLSIEALIVRRWFRPSTSAVIA